MDDVAIQAMSLTDGADIHDVAGRVAIYRSLTRDGLDTSEMERELRAYIAHKRQERVFPRVSDCRSLMRQAILE